jgi:hypothetical protein
LPNELLHGSDLWHVPRWQKLPTQRKHAAIMSIERNINGLYCAVYSVVTSLLFPPLLDLVPSFRWSLLAMRIWSSLHACVCGMRSWNLLDTPWAKNVYRKIDLPILCFVNKTRVVARTGKKIACTQDRLFAPSQVTARSLLPPSDVYYYLKMDKEHSPDFLTVTLYLQL